MGDTVQSNTSIPNSYSSSSSEIPVCIGESRTLVEASPDIDPEELRNRFNIPPDKFCRAFSHAVGKYYFATTQVEELSPSLPEYSRPPKKESGGNNGPKKVADGLPDNVARNFLIDTLGRKHVELASGSRNKILDLATENKRLQDELKSLQGLDGSAIHFFSSWTGKGVVGAASAGFTFGVLIPSARDIHTMIRFGFKPFGEASLLRAYIDKCFKEGDEERKLNLRQLRRLELRNALITAPLAAAAIGAAYKAEPYLFGPNVASKGIQATSLASSSPLEQLKNMQITLPDLPLSDYQTLKTKDLNALSEIYDRLNQAQSEYHNIERRLVSENATLREQVNLLKTSQEKSRGGMIYAGLVGTVLGFGYAVTKAEEMYGYSLLHRAAENTRGRVNDKLLRMPCPEVNVPGYEPAPAAAPDPMPVRFPKPEDSRVSDAHADPASVAVGVAVPTVAAAAVVGTVTAKTTLFAKLMTGLGVAVRAVASAPAAAFGLMITFKKDDVPRA